MEAMIGMMHGDNAGGGMELSDCDEDVAAPEMEEVAEEIARRRSIRESPGQRLVSVYKGHQSATEEDN